MTKKKVFVAISGGVDSSVSLALLRDQGFEVTGVYFKTYKPDGDRSYCRQQGLDAQKVCEQLSVPFKVFDLQEEYRERVFEYMLREYRAGRTPNPDIMCNKAIKFGAFAEKAFAEGADYIATGHYARTQQQRGLTSLLEGVDESKDQSYFLSQISGEVLARTLFPLGAFEKSETRALAEQYGLHTASKPDSQGICFIGHELDVKAFLKRYIPEQEGLVLNSAGERIGMHSGAVFLTIGERHGFTIGPQHQTPNMSKLFVIAKDAAANTVTVGTEQELAEATPLQVTLAEPFWRIVPQEEREYHCRLRHRGARIPCTITQTTNGQGESLTIEFKEPPYAPAAGQFLAVYDGEVCLGGGVMV